MKRVVVACIGICLSGPGFASEALSSELSHTLAGALMAGASTAIADRYWPEHRALVGFSVSVTAGVLGEVYDSTRPNGKFSFLDVAVTAAGAALGTLGTDKLILSPAVSRELTSRYYGLVAGCRF